MARKRKTEDVAGATPDGEASIGEDFTLSGAPAETASSGEPKRRNSLTVPLKDDGTIDWDGMRPATAEKFRLATGAGPSHAMSFSPDEIGWLYTGLGSLEAWVCAKFFGVPPELAARIFAYSKEEVDELAKPTAAVLSKYCGSLLAYQDEMALCFTLYGIHSKKFAYLQAIMQQRAQEEQQHAEPPRANGKTTDIPA